MDVTILIHQSLFAGAAIDEADDVIERARRGDREAFREIFDEHHVFIGKFLYSMIGDRALAEDLTQETFMQAYRGIKTFRGDAKLSTWLCGIAKNTASVSMRSRRHESNRIGFDDDRITNRNDERSSAPDEQLLDKELQRVVRHALSTLDEDKRLVFTLKVLQGRSYEEIMEVTGSSLAKLKTDLHRAKLEMRRLIRPILESNDEV